MECRFKCGMKMAPGAERGTRMCNGCWELHTRLRHYPIELVQRIGRAVNLTITETEKVPVT